jgi:hypothetical protein
LALGMRVGLEAIACKPVIAVACLSLCAVGTIATRLPCDISTVESFHLEAVFGNLLLGVGREISWGQKFVDNGLVLTDTPAEDSSVVSIVVNTPLDIHDFARGVSDDRGVSPIGCWAIVVETDSSIVAARATSTHQCSREIRPSGNTLENCAFWACIYSCLEGGS